MAGDGRFGHRTINQTHPSVSWGVATLIFAALTAFLSPALEDSVLPTLVFSTVGIAWVMARRGAQERRRWPAMRSITSK
jgi:hypothetical protein